MAWFQFEWDWSSVKVTESWKSKNSCNHSVVMLHEATHMFMMVDYVQQMTSKKSCKAGEYELFEHLFFLLILIVLKTLPCWPCGMASGSRRTGGRLPLFLFKPYQWLRNWLSGGSLLGTWHHRVNAKTGGPSNSMLWMDEMATLIRNFCPSATACTIVFSDLTLSCCWDTKQPRKKQNDLLSWAKL